MHRIKVLHSNAIPNFILFDMYGSNYFKRHKIYEFTRFYGLKDVFIYFEGKN